MTVELILVSFGEFWAVVRVTKSASVYFISCLRMILNILLKMTVELILVNFGEFWAVVRGTKSANVSVRFVIRIAQGR